MQRRARRNLLLNKLHRGVVMVCIGLTIYGTGHLGMRWYRYLTVLRPEAKKRELLEKQALLAEGSSSTFEDKNITISA